MKQNKIACLFLYLFFVCKSYGHNYNNCRPWPTLYSVVGSDHGDYLILSIHLNNGNVLWYWLHEDGGFIRHIDFCTVDLGSECIEARFNINDSFPESFKIKTISYYGDKGQYPSFMEFYLSMVTLERLSG
ncbi:hypothetical protein ACWJJH_17625 [Endozoicomonadaceae bacterium StTr2]